MTTREAIPDLRPRVDNSVAADEALRSDPAHDEVAALWVGLEVRGRRAEHGVRADERPLADRDVVVNDAVRLDGDTLADVGCGAYDARRMHPRPGHRTIIGALSERARAVSAGVDSTALCEARMVGSGSRVLAFALIGPEVEIGDDCVVGAHAVLEGAVTLAEGVQVQAGARLVGPLTVGPGATIDANSVIAGDGAIAVGRGAIVKAGSVVTESVPANAIVSGNPARIVAYVDSGHEAPAQEVVMPSPTAVVTETGVRGVTIHALTNARDLRGSLTAAEFAELPFTPQRLFTVFDVPSESVRGSHAHRECAQFLVCLAGAVSCLVDDGSTREEISLASSEFGLHIPPLVWGTQWRYSGNAVLLVLASHPYDPADYIRDYEEFLAVVDRA